MEPAPVSRHLARGSRYARVRQRLSFDARAGWPGSTMSRCPQRSMSSPASISCTTAASPSTRPASVRRTTSRATTAASLPAGTRSTARSIRRAVGTLRRQQRSSAARSSGSGAVGWKPAEDAAPDRQLRHRVPRAEPQRAVLAGLRRLLRRQPGARPGAFAHGRSRTRLAASMRPTDLDARAFSTRVHDLIDFSGGSTFQAINVDHAAIDGVELTHALARRRVVARQRNATLQNPRNSDTGAQLLRRPKQKFVERARRRDRRARQRGRRVLSQRQARRTSAARRWAATRW